MSARPIEENLDTDKDREILYGDDDEPETDSKSTTTEKDSDDSDEGEEEESEEPEEEEEEDSSETEEAETEDEDESLNETVGAPLSGRPTYRQVVDKYPKIFKDFPGLRDVFFRERDFSRIYATVEDAQDSYDQLNRLKAGEQVISNGNPKDFLEILRDYDVNKERKFIGDFLPQLYRNNKPAFEAITTPVIQHALRSMHSDAKRNGNENLTNSALNVYEWLFGEGDINAQPRRQPVPEGQTQEDPEKEELRKENSRLLQTRHDEFIDTALGSASRKINSTIVAALPEGVSEFDKKSITREVMDRLTEVLRSDSAHRSNMDRLIRKGKDERYSAEARERLSTAFLSRAKLALPEIIKKVKSEALRDKAASSNRPRPSVPNRPNGSNGKVAQRVREKKDDLAAQVRKGKISERAFLES